MQNSTDVNLKNDFYVKFRNSIYYDMPLGDSPIIHYEKWLYLIHNVKLEILANLQIMPLLSVVPYLHKLKIEIEEDSKGCTTNKHQYNELLKRFEISEKVLLNNQDTSNVLFKVMDSPSVTDKNLAAEEFHREAGDLQFVFLNYHLGQFATQLLVFLKDQLDYYKQLTINTISQEKAVVEPISEDSINEFLKDLQYNYPYRNSPIGFLYSWLDDFKYFKREVVENLAKTNADARDLYLEKLLLRFEEHKDSAIYSPDVFLQELENYKLTEEGLLTQPKNDNIFTLVIRRDPPTYHETFEPDYIKETEYLQKVFYSYYYDQFVNDAIVFLHNKLSYKKQETAVQNNMFSQSEDGDSIKSFYFSDWSKEGGKIAALHQSLKTNSFIDSSVTLPLFKKLFEGKPFESKIKWTGNLSQLSYFIKQLITKDSIVCKKQQHWKIVVQYIEMADGKELDNRILTRQKKPAHTILLDEALKAL